MVFSLNKSILVVFWLFLGILFFVDSSNAQQWNVYPEISNLSFVKASWRNLDTDEGAMIEWVFINTSDSLVEYNYHIKTELDETIHGRIQLLPHQHKLSGWVLQGKSINLVSVDKVQIEGRGNFAPSK